jgi:DNA mismatch repair protein MSH6
VVLPEGVSGLGDHEHNRFDFLHAKNRKDKAGRRPDDPLYNPRTLLVPDRFLREQTPAMQQWWKFKADNMDTVLMFKVRALSTHLAPI